MADIAGYELGDKINEGVLTAVWEAWRAEPGSPARRFVVKTAGSTSALFDEEEARQQALAFLDGALVQTRVAEAGAQHWAPIHKSGRANAVAYYVTDYYGHSVRHLTEGRVNLSLAALHNIIASIVKGLEELRAACDRPHGNIKPANVLIEGTGGAETARVRLTDPLPSREVDPKSGAVADLKAVGALLYELVTHRAFIARECWPIGPSPHWEAFGDGWRELCSQMLVPDPVEGPLSLEAVAAELDRLAPPPAGLSTSAQAVLCGIGVLVVGVGMFLAWTYLFQAGETPRTKGKAGSTGTDTAHIEHPSDIEPPGEWLARTRAQATVAQALVVNRAWVARRDALVPATLTAEALAAHADDYVVLRGRVAALAEFLRALDDPDALPAGLPASAKGVPDGATRDAVGKAVGVRREQALVAIVGGIPWGPAKAPSAGIAEFKSSAQWAQPQQAYVAWREQAGQLLVAFGPLERALASGCGPDEKPPGAAKPLRQLHADWMQRKLPTELARVFTPTTDELARRLAIGGLGRDELVGRVRQLGKDAPPTEVLAIWKALASRADWPRDLPELALAAKLRDAVAQAAATLKKTAPEAADEAAVRLEATGPEQWERGFNALTRAADPAKLDAPDLTRAVALAPRFGVASEKLAPPTRLRWALYTLRTTTAALLRGGKADAAAPAIAAFEREVAQLPGGISTQPAVARLLGQLRALAARSKAGTAPAGGAAAGPLAGAMRGKWEAIATTAAGAIAYTWREKGHTLAFVRIEPPGTPPCFLCTTEVSVGLFADVVAATDRSVAFTGLLATDEAKWLAGPRVWKWQAGKEGGKHLVRAARWLPGVAPAGDAPPIPPPSDQHPMQHVSAPAAVTFAWLLGCRLPTAAEWRAAYAKYQKGRPPGKLNLRDPAWEAHLARLRARKAPPAPGELPDAGIFWPAAVAIRRVGADAVPATAASDGTVWLDPVGAGTIVQHLIGNVAEFVLDLPAAQLGELKTLASTMVPEVVGPVVRARMQKLGGVSVVGASALSPPQVWDGRDRPFDKAWPARYERGGLDSYSDVGFRLAFTAPRESPGDELARLLREHGYLPGGK